MKPSYCLIVVFNSIEHCCHLMSGQSVRLHYYSHVFSTFPLSTYMSQHMHVYTFLNVTTVVSPSIPNNRAAEQFGIT